uniref:(northern house mosquito) hypothetical protein n=1 Tax=Culex pipiens TaxID=7175 RepID=A0A8D8K4C7_CULPI
MALGVAVPLRSWADSVEHLPETNIRQHRWCPKNVEHSEIVDQVGQVPETNDHQRRWCCSAGCRLILAQTTEEPAPPVGPFLPHPTSLPNRWFPCCLPKDLSPRL